MRKAEKEDTSRIGYYFRKETGLLLVVTVTGILYNIGMVAGPWFEGHSRGMPAAECTVYVKGRKRKALW